MKKTFGLFLLLLFGVFGAASAQKNLTSTQRQVQSQILSFLRTEGFTPSIDPSDNSITFKRSGDKYWIYVEESGPFYITTQLAGYSNDDYQRSACILAANDCNSKKKAAKVYNTASATVFVVEQFCSTAAEYGKVFYRIMSVLEACREQFDQEYQTYID